MKKLITLNDFPFLLTLLFGLVGYQINNITNNILSSPSVEYDLTLINSHIQNHKVVQSYECVVTNITNDKLFKDLTINFISEKGSKLKIFNPKIIPLPPSSQHYSTPFSLDKQLLVYTILKLQPGDRYKLTFEGKNNKDFPKELPSIYLTSDNAVKIIDKSIATWFVKKFNLINLSLIVIWTILILLYFKVINLNSNEKIIS